MTIKQKLGVPVKFKKAKLPSKKNFRGQHVVLEPIIISRHSKDLYNKFRGQAKNPNLESIFKSVPFREFSFPFTFAPKA